MASILLKNGYIVTVDPKRRVIPNGWVQIENDQIAGIGAMDELGKRSAKTEVDLHGMLTMPGLINGHNHHWGSLFKNTGEGLLLEPWLCQVPLPLMSQLGSHACRIPECYSEQYPR